MQRRSVLPGIIAALAAPPIALVTPLAVGADTNLMSIAIYSKDPSKP